MIRGLKRAGKKYFNLLLLAGAAYLFLKDRKVSVSLGGLDGCSCGLACPTCRTEAGIGACQPNLGCHYGMGCYSSPQGAGLSLVMQGGA